MARNISFPLQVDGSGRTKSAADAVHIRQMIGQLLFTAPGERVNRPQLGTGVMQLVFAPNSPELAAATEFMIQSALQQHLGDLIKPERVSVEAQDATLRITVQYLIQRSQQRQIAQFEREV